VYVAGLAIDYLLYHGEDYRQSEKFLNEVYKIRFTGCSDTIRFETDTHERTFLSGYLFQIYYSDDTKKYEAMNVQKLSPYSSNFRQMSGSSWRFPDGTTNMPDQKRSDSFDWPFAKDEV
jgi:hypothetical protein